jgi:toxin ParE1/3/4
LNNIWNYTIQKWSENQAQKYYELIKLSCKEISKDPTIGKKYPKLGENLFGLKTGRHIIFYLLIPENEIEVVRILHERMDLKNNINR